MGIGAANGLKFYDTVAGYGAEAIAGSSATVHFDCIYRGIDVVSSRSARLLGGNRSVAEPFQFVAGESVSKKLSQQAIGDSAGGLFSGVSGPKPPPALSFSVVGMKVGGKVRRTGLNRSQLLACNLGGGRGGCRETARPLQSSPWKVHGRRYFLFHKRSSLCFLCLYAEDGDCAT